MKLAFETKTAMPGLGLIVLQADETLEHDFARMVDPDLARLHHSRIPMPQEVRPDTLQGMLEVLPAVAQLLPTGLGAIGYSCTSASAVIGPDRVAQAVGLAHPAVPVSDPLSALIEAARYLRTGKLAILNPYVTEVAQPIRAHFEDAGFEIQATASFEQSDDRIVAQIAPESILHAAQRLVASAQVEALVISCTNLRALPVIAQIEHSTGVPVLSSNQAMAWHMLQLADLQVPNQPAFGRLFTDP